MREQMTAHTALALLGALLVYGCASSSRSSLPSPPQLPSPSPPSAGKPESAPPTASPQTPSPTSPQGQGEGKAGQQGQAGGGPGSKGETGAGSSSGSPASGGGPAAGTSSGAGTAASGAGATGATGGTSGAGGGEGMARTPGEQSDALDRQLQAGLAEFDSLLLREQKALEEKQRNQPLPPRGAAFTATTDDNAYDILEGPARHWSHFEKLQDDTAVVPFRLELAKTNVDQALYVKGYVDYDVLYIDTQTTPAPDDIVVDLVYAALLDDWAQEDRDTGRLDDAKSKEEKANNVRIKLTPRMLQWAKPRGRLVGVFKA